MRKEQGREIIKDRPHAGGKFGDFLQNHQGSRKDIGETRPGFPELPRRTASSQTPSGVVYLEESSGGKGMKEEHRRKLKEGQ